MASVRQLQLQQQQALVAAVTLDTAAAASSSSSRRRLSAAGPSAGPIAGSALDVLVASAGFAAGTFKRGKAICPEGGLTFDDDVRHGIGWGWMGGMITGKVRGGEGGRAWLRLGLAEADSGSQGMKGCSSRDKVRRWGRHRKETRLHICTPLKAHAGHQ